MNWDTIKGKWNEMKGKIREKWGKLTDDDLDRIGGKKDQLVGQLQQKYGYAKERAEEEIDRFCADCTDTGQAGMGTSARRQSTREGGR
jgi:uncharacterized protein YjbJ (UPF0337 family)